MTMESWVAQQPVLTWAVVWVRELSRMRWTSKAAGTCESMWRKKAMNSWLLCRRSSLLTTRPVATCESTCERRAPGSSTGPESRGTLSMSLESDLSRLIRDQFDKNGISFKRSMRLERLTARYFEMTTRLIQPVPRDVHFSDQIYTSLGELSREGESDSSARDAWGMVFGLRQHLVDGVNVNAFLSKNICNADGWDGLLWTYGMHHFHLGRETDKDGFVKRSKHLLFAIVTPTDAYFVDVRPHPPKDGIGWVSQELLQIVHSSWPNLIEANAGHPYPKQLTS